MIESIASELKAVRDKTPKDPVIQFNGCTLELAVKVTAEGGGKFKFWLVDVSAEASGELISKVTLTFGAVPGAPLQAVALVDVDEKGPSPHTLKGMRK